MKKIISLLCVVAMFFAMTCCDALAANPSITATISGNANAVGDEFTVKVAYAGVEGLFTDSKYVFNCIIGFQFELLLPEGYEFGDLKNKVYGEPEEGDDEFFDVSPNKKSDTLVAFAANASSKKTSAVVIDGACDIMTFPVKCTAAPATDVTIQIQNAKILVEEYSGENTIVGTTITYAGGSTLTVNNATITAAAPASADEELVPQDEQVVIDTTKEGTDNYTINGDGDIITIGKRTFIADKSKGEFRNGVAFGFKMTAPADIAGYRWIVKINKGEGQFETKGTEPYTFGTYIDKDSEVAVADAFDNGNYQEAGLNVANYDIVLKVYDGDQDATNDKYIYTNTTGFFNAD